MTYSLAGCTVQMDNKCVRAQRAACMAVAICVALYFAGPMDAATLLSAAE